MDEMIKYDGSVLLVSLGGLKTYFVLLSLRLEEVVIPMYNLLGTRPQGHV